MDALALPMLVLSLARPLLSFENVEACLFASRPGDHLEATGKKCASPLLRRLDRLRLADSAFEFDVAFDKGLAPSCEHFEMLRLAARLAERFEPGPLHRRQRFLRIGVVAITVVVVLLAVLGRDGLAALKR